MAKLPKFPHLSGNQVEEHDGNIRFQSRIGNMAVLCMCNARGHNHRDSSFIVDLATGQIPRSTKCISSLVSNPAIAETQPKSETTVLESKPKSAKTQTNQFIFAVTPPKF